MTTPISRRATPPTAVPQWRMCPECVHAEGLHYGPCSFFVTYSPPTTCGCDRRPQWMDPPPPTAVEPEPGLRQALDEMVAAFTSKPDTDELDHPEGLTTAQVEMAWAQWDLRQSKAIDLAQSALAASSGPAKAVEPEPDRATQIERIAVVHGEWCMQADEFMEHGPRCHSDLTDYAAALYEAGLRAASSGPAKEPLDAERLARAIKARMDIAPHRASQSTFRAVGVLDYADAIAAEYLLLADPPKTGEGFDEADNMCPNCVTPWKCNGPHEFAETVAGKRAAASSGPATAVAPEPDDLTPRLLTAWRRTKDFLADRLATSGRSDVNINAVLREMNSAFDDAASSVTE